MFDFPHLPRNAMSYAKRKLLYGHGINDSSYLVCLKKGVKGNPTGRNIECPFYTVWCHVLCHTYSENYHKKHPTSAENSMVPEWHSFTVFRDWMNTQKWQNKNLNKRILEHGNKVYGPETCVFVAREIINIFVCGRKKKSANIGLPIGVCFNRNRTVNRKGSGEFVATYNNCGRQGHLGVFTTAQAAHQAYIKAKVGHIRELAALEPEPIRSALLRHADLIAA